jgi:DUF1707 SHOCT-like domain
VDETPVTPALRASDAERDQLAGTLRAHLAAGRLTVDEFSERLERAFRATRVDELEALVADLPAPRVSPAPAPPPPGRLWPGNLPFKTRIRSAKSVTAVRDKAMRSVVPELIADGYRLTSQSPTSLILERTYRPAWTYFLAVIVFPVGLVALLHTDSSQVVIHLESVGSGSLVQVSGTARRRVRGAVRELGS